KILHGETLFCVELPGKQQGEQPPEKTQNAPAGRVESDPLDPPIHPNPPPQPAAGWMGGSSGSLFVRPEPEIQVFPPAAAHMAGTGHRLPTVEELPQTRHLVVDVETFSPVDLKKTGSHFYAAQPATGVSVVCYALGSGPVGIWTPGEPVPEDIAGHIAAGG